MPERGNKVQLRIVVDRDVADMLVALAGGPRKQGETVSSLVRAAWEARQGESQQPVDRRQFEALARRVAEIEARLPETPSGQ